MLEEQQLQEVYQWIDEIPLSRPKRNIARDFSDGVSAAEVVKYYFPKLVELHNYPPANSSSQKLYNWIEKVLRKLGINLTDEEISHLANARPNHIETFLADLRQRLDQLKLQQQQLRASHHQLYQSRQSLQEQFTNSPMPYTHVQNTYPPQLIADPQLYAQYHQQQQQQRLSPASGLPPMLPPQQQVYAPMLALRNPAQLPPIPNPQAYHPSMQLMMNPNTMLPPIGQDGNNYMAVSNQGKPGTTMGKRNDGGPALPAPSTQARLRPSIHEVNKGGDNHTTAVLEMKLKEKDILLTDLKETVDILQLKIEKLEQLVSLKDRRIAEMASNQ